MIKAYLIGIRKRPDPFWLAHQSYEEIAALADTAGLAIAGREFVEVRRIHPATLIGTGKIEQLKDLFVATDVDVVVIDATLTPTQNRNLENLLAIRVIDRTSLILDIFAQHARSNEGKLQVELAQYQYLYPRLVGQWTHLSKQRGGGVGLRGPGEMQLEVDRRRVKERMTHLRKKLRRVTLSRQIHRKKREGVPIPTVTCVGYTNAGKTTLFNALTEKHEPAENKLFATLDPKTTRVKLPSGRPVLLTDTVGFIRNLPHQLIEAFAATFEEARHSDLLIHVIDSSHEDTAGLVRIVEAVLKDLSLDHIPVINVLNKADISSLRLTPAVKGALTVSATQGWGLDRLLHAIDQQLARLCHTIQLFIPHPYGAKLAQLYRYGRVLTMESRADGLAISAALPEKWYRRFRQYALLNPAY